MPPFGKELSERDAKPLPFLSLSYAPAKAQRRPSRAFGAERNEQDVTVKSENSSSSCVRKVSTTTKPKGFQPFQDEPEEARCPLGKKQKVGGVSKPMVPFADEQEEGQSTSDDQSGADEDFAIKSTSVFALGWQTMLNLKQGTFWKQNQDDLTGAKQKRQYDNSKRAENALYLNKDKAGCFKKAGSNPERIDSLLTEPACRCAMVAHNSWDTIQSPTNHFFSSFPKLELGCILMFTISKHREAVATHPCLPVTVTQPRPEVRKRSASSSSHRPGTSNSLWLISGS